MTKKDLPIYNLSVDDIETFVDSIALVENPAIEKGFIAFSETPKQALSFNDEKMELLGAAIIPDLLIYRRTDDGYEYNVKFTADEIRFIAQTFSKNSRQANLNIEHTKVNADSYVFQSMIVDRSKGIAPLDLPDGTWVIGVKVNNQQVWNDIKEGKRKGFSIEGVFQLIEAKFSKDEYLNEKLLMTLIEKYKNELLSVFKKAVEQDENLAANTPDEIKVSDMVVGGKVEVVGEDGSLQPAPDGEMDYNGHKLEIKDGLIVSIDGDKGEEMPAEDMADMPAEDAPANPNAELQAQVDELKSAIEEINKKLDAQAADNSKMEAMSEKFTQQMEELNASIKTILTTPAEFSKTNSSVKVKDEADAKMAEIARIGRMLNSSRK